MLIATQDGKHKNNIPNPTNAVLLFGNPKHWNKEQPTPPKHPTKYQFWSTFKCTLDFISC